MALGVVVGGLLGGVLVAYAADLLTLDDGATVRFRIADSGAAHVVANEGTEPGLKVTSNGSASVALRVDSTQGAFLPPRMTTAQRDAISPALAGMQIYNTTTNTLDLYDGASWFPVGSTAPTLISATVNGVILDLTYASQSGLDTTSPAPANGDFTIGGTLASAQTVTGVSVSASVVTLTLNPGVVGSDLVTVSYTPGTNPIRDSLTNRAAVALTNEAVTNITQAPAQDHQAVLSLNPVVYYKFADASTSVTNDGTGGATYDGTIGPPYAYVTGAFGGQALELGASSGYTAGPILSHTGIGSNVSHENWSLTMVLRFTTPPPGTIFFWIWRNTAIGFANFVIDANGVPGLASYAGSWAYHLGTTNIADGNWHNVTITHTSTRAYTIYVDGVQEGSGTTNDTYGRSETVNGFKIQSSGGVVQVDSAGFWTATLSSSDATTIYNALMP